MKQVSELPIKKPYQAPKLTVYGDLTQLTMTSGKGKGMPDGTMKFQT
jgi:hypothetical protein